jgi:hypothetical protein
MVTPDLKALGLKQTASAPKLVSGNVATPSDRGWQISLRPQPAEVLCLGWQSDNEPNPEGCQPVAGGRQGRSGPLPDTHLSNRLHTSAGVPEPSTYDVRHFDFTWKSAPSSCGL